MPTLLPRTHLNVVDTPFLVPAHGERPGQEPRFHDCAEPFPTLPAVRQPDLVLMQLIANYNGNMGMRDAADALSTVTTHERHALFEVKLNDVMVDVRMRMLTIKELARGQSFPDSYQWHGSPRSVRRQIGNAIPVVTSERLVSTILQPILRGN